MPSSLRRFLLVLLAGLCGQVAVAQTPRWAQSQPIAYQFNYEYIHGAAAALPGGGAWWAAPLDFHQNYGTAELGTVRLTRLRAGGTAAVQRTIRGDVGIQHLVSAPDGGAVLTGYFTDSLIFDAQHQIRIPNPNLGLLHFVARLDSAGQVLWLRRLADDLSGQITAIDGVTFDSQGQLWLGYEDFVDSYLTRYGPTGDSLQTIVQRGVRRVTSVAVAPDGTIYSAGSCADQNASFAGQVFPNSFPYNIYVACYEPSGQVRWVRYVEDGTCPTPQVATADTGGVYFTSYLFGQPMFGTIQPAGPAWNADFFLARLDRATGSFQWVRETPQVLTGYAVPAPINPLVVDGAGNAWLLTQETGTIQWSPTLTTSVGPQGNSYGAQLLAYDVQGNLRTAIATGSSGYCLAQGLSIDRATNHAALTGLGITGTTALGAVTLPAASLGAPQPFIVGFDATLAPLSLPAEAPELAAVTVFPNPAVIGSMLTVRGLPVGPATLTLLDATGRVVATRQRVGNGAAEEVNLLTSGELAGGLYAVRCATPHGTVTRRVAVTR